MVLLLYMLAEDNYFDCSFFWNGTGSHLLRRLSDIFSIDIYSYQSKTANLHTDRSNCPRFYLYKYVDLRTPILSFNPRRDQTNDLLLPHPPNQSLPTLASSTTLP